ncbi:hypothetical protein J1N35_022303, partial [Gossypium stocksii]
DRESMRPYDAIWEKVLLQGIDVHGIPREICEFYNAPYYELNFVDNSDLEYYKNINMDNIINYLMK